MGIVVPDVTIARISIHALRKESDKSLVNSFCNCCHFNPRSP